MFCPQRAKYFLVLYIVRLACWCVLFLFFWHSVFRILGNSACDLKDAFSTVMAIFVLIRTLHYNGLNFTYFPNLFINNFAECGGVKILVFWERALWQFTSVCDSNNALAYAVRFKSSVYIYWQSHLCILIANRPSPALHANMLALKGASPLHVPSARRANRSAYARTWSFVWFPFAEEKRKNMGSLQTKLGPRLPSVQLRAFLACKAARAFQFKTLC
jgi:hypothetical protein